MSVYLRGKLSTSEAVASVTEGAILGIYDAGLHKSDAKKLKLQSLRIGGAGSGAHLDGVVDRAVVMATATNFARSLINEPANYMTPRNTGRARAIRGA